MSTFLTVDIGESTYDVYCSLEFADNYLAADTNAAVWRETQESGDVDDNARAIVTATRILDRMVWQGSKTDEEQDHAWPRTGMVGVGEDEIPTLLAEACAELASAIRNGYDASNTQSTARSEKRLKAGSVEIEYFRGAEGKALRLPLPVWEMIRQWLSGTAGIGGAQSFGTCGDSITDQSYGLTRGV